jgi:hypothetical protein
MDRLFEMRVWLRNLGSRFIPVALPWSFLMAVTDMNFGLLATWFEPLALRLNPWRSALWLALRVAPSFAVNLLPSMNVTSRMLVLILLPALLEVPVLWRRRSHPWMPVVGAASSTFISFQFSLTPYWLSVQAFSLCYAIPLLYGTRLLTPKERERALLAREPAQ